MPNGDCQEVILVGGDDHTLAGIPTTVVQGNLDDLKHHNAVMLDDLAAKKLSTNPKQPLTISDRFEINGTEAIVVAICNNARSVYLYNLLTHKRVCTWR